GRHPDFLEIGQVLQPPFGACDQRAVIWIAFGHVELAPDHMISSADIAANVDLLDVDAGAILDRKGEIDLPRFRDAVRARAHRHEREALPGGLDRHVLNGLFDRLGVEYVAWGHAQAGSHYSGLERAHGRPHVDGPDPELFALLDHEPDHEAAHVGVVFDRRRENAHVDIAVLEIEPAQELAVRLDSIGVVHVAALKERQDAAFRGLDHLFQAIARIGAVADEFDRPDVGPGTLGDLEDQIDAIVRQIDDNRIDANVVTAAAPVHLHDALHVRLHDRTRQSAALLGLDLELELLVLDLAVAFESDAIDDRVLHHGHDDPPAGHLDSDILKQTGGDEGLIGFVDLERPNAAVGARLEVGANGIGFDAPIAFDHDGIDGLRIGSARRHHADANT